MARGIIRSARKSSRNHLIKRVASKDIKKKTKKFPKPSRTETDSRVAPSTSTVEPPRQTGFHSDSEKGYALVPLEFRDPYMPWSPGPKIHYIPERPDQETMQIDEKREKMSFVGLNDDQINVYLSKILKFKDLDPDYLCESEDGEVVAMKAGYMRVMCRSPSATSDDVSIPSSMEQKHWDILNTKRQEGKTIFFFVSRDYVKAKIQSRQRRNQGIPSEEDLHKASSKTRMYVDNKEKEFILVPRPTHTAILKIKGLKFTLHDINNFQEMDKSENAWAVRFFNSVETRVYPKIYSTWGLLKDDTTFAMTEENYYPMGVHNSCALFLLFIIEQTVNRRPIIDCNWSPALAQLYCSKVIFHVGGDVDYPTFRRRNPGYPHINKKWQFELLLDDLKNGLYLTIPELNSKKEEVLKDIEIWDY